MINFWESAVLPALDARRPRRLVEIGAAGGGQTRKVLDWAAANDAVLHVFDPRPGFDVADHESRWGPHFVMHKALSLEALPRIGPLDMVLLDGDHNWYTVFSELRLIDAINDVWPVLLMHDVGWPYGRRDMYYSPDNVPARYRQPHRRSGFLKLRSELTDAGRNSNLFNATHEGGPCNGVLTAAEDFLACTPRELALLARFGPGGLGILVGTDELREDPALAAVLATIHEPEFAVSISPLHATRELDAEQISPRAANRIRAAAGSPLESLSGLDAELRLARAELCRQIAAQAGT
jgi:Methyltransferase domain